MKKGKLTVTAWFKPDDPQSVMHTKIFLENFYKHYLLYVFKNKLLEQNFDTTVARQILRCHSQYWSQTAGSQDWSVQ